MDNNYFIPEAYQIEIIIKGASNDVSVADFYNYFKEIYSFERSNDPITNGDTNNVLLLGDTRIGNLRYNLSRGEIKTTIGTNKLIVSSFLENLTKLFGEANYEITSFSVACLNLNKGIERLFISPLGSNAESAMLNIRLNHEGESYSISFIKQISPYSLYLMIEPNKSPIYIIPKGKILDNIILESISDKYVDIVNKYISELVGE